MTSDRLSNWVGEGSESLCEVVGNRLIEKDNVLRYPFLLLCFIAFGVIKI